MDKSHAWWNLRKKYEWHKNLPPVTIIKHLVIDGTEPREIIEINDIRPGDRIQLKIWRNGRYINKKLKLGKI